MSGPITGRLLALSAAATAEGRHVLGALLSIVATDVDADPRLGAEMAARLRRCMTEEPEGPARELLVEAIALLHDPGLAATIARRAS